MSDLLPRPPRCAEGLLRLLLRPADYESVPGDLLEEYREVRRPSLGRRRANLWYVGHVLSVLWHVTWPCAVALAALRVLSLTAGLGRWNPGLVPAPGVSILDGLLFLWIGYSMSKRTQQLLTGVVVTLILSVVSFKSIFVYAAISDPGLLRAPFRQPFILVIFTALFGIALGFALVTGTIGAAAGRWFPVARRADPS